ncbi:MAG: thiamine diphosphokinase [Holosporales bacterium]|jgi:thiamine pyrophosphokinase|nr:thiamine diphosphokinase [Holosporales bacterium]
MSYTFDPAQIQRIIDLKKYNSVLCLDGSLPDPNFILGLDLPIIATDGAANQLVDANVIPDVVIGDLDSIRPNLMLQLNCIQMDDQNSSDFQKALNHMQRSGLLPSIILGMNGGYADHIINNINIFSDCDGSIFLTQGMIGIRITHESTLSLPINAKLSIMGFPRALVSTSGLRWDLSRSRIEFCGHNSWFNRALTGTVDIIVHTGQALVMVYLEGIVDAGVNTESWG